MTEQNIICIYHGGCADGFGAAYSVRQALGEGVVFKAAKYGAAPPDVAGMVVVIVDFSFPLETLRAMAEVAEAVVVIDHHKTAADDLAALPAAPCSYEDWRAAGERLSAVFDMNRSGAGLTWDFFNPGQARPALVDYIEDRDLWCFRLCATRQVMAGLFSYPQDFDVWRRFMESDEGVQHLYDSGEAIERKQAKDVADVIAGAQRRMIIGGFDVPVVNAPYVMASDIGNILSAQEPFAATYYDAADGRVFSLRSSEAGMDVGLVAKQYGGGGHRNAAGFRVPHSHVLAGGQCHE